MSTPTISQIIPVVILGSLIVAVVIHILNACKTGSVSFGYKYYPPGQTCTRKENPATFWSIISVYSLSVIGCSSLVIFILTHPIV